MPSVIEALQDIPADILCIGIVFKFPVRHLQDIIIRRQRGQVICYIIDDMIALNPVGGLIVNHPSLFLDSAVNQNDIRILFCIIVGRFSRNDAIQSDKESQLRSIVYSIPHRIEFHIIVGNLVRIPGLQNVVISTVPQIASQGPAGEFVPFPRAFIFRKRDFTQSQYSLRRNGAGAAVGIEADIHLLKPDRVKRDVPGRNNVPLIAVICHVVCSVAGRSPSRK